MKGQARWAGTGNVHSPYHSGPCQNSDTAGSTQGQNGLRHRLRKKKRHSERNEEIQRKERLEPRHPKWSFFNIYFGFKWIMLIKVISTFFTSVPRSSWGTETASCRWVTWGLASTVTWSFTVRSKAASLTSWEEKTETFTRILWKMQ